MASISALRASTYDKTVSLLAFPKRYNANWPKNNEPKIGLTPGKRKCLGLGKRLKG